MLSGIRASSAPPGRPFMRSRHAPTPQRSVEHAACATNAHEPPNKQPLADRCTRSEASRQATARPRPNEITTDHQEVPPQQPRSRRQARARALNDSPNTAKASYFAVFCPPPARFKLSVCLCCRSVCSLSIVCLPFFRSILLFLLALRPRSLYRLHHALYLRQPNSPFFASLKHAARLDSERYARRRPALQAQSHPVQPTP